MDLNLIRIRKASDGIFSKLVDPQTSKVIAYSVTHAYQQIEGQWTPKVPVGTYRCLRGQHSLDGVHEFDAFEICDVPGHSGILFHKGNVQEESHGCELLGDSIGPVIIDAQPPEQGVEHSGDAFNRFMAAQAGVNQFWLTVTDETEVEDESTIASTATGISGSLVATSEGSDSQLDDPFQRVGRGAVGGSTQLAAGVPPAAGLSAG